MDKFSFQTFGRVFSPVYIMPKNDTTMQAVYFMVDTGADTSTISKQTLLGLGYDIDWIRKNTIVLEESDKPKTAVGEKVNAGYIQLPLINVLGYEGKNWAFQIVIDEDQDFASLLGRDLLTGFNYTFDNDKDEFTIDRALAFKPRMEFLPGQEINAITSS